MTFQNFGLAQELVRATNELGYDTPTPIQTQAIPIILHGSDVMALAQTGTGKTAGFTLPLLHLLNANHNSNQTKRNVRALILTPTRELASQVGESVKKYGRYLPLRCEVIFGGVNITPQIRKLQRGTDIIIATPGRLLDLVEQDAVSLANIEMLVLDEADRMLDMGFIRDIKKILALLPKKRQNMLFSATLSAEIQSLAASLLNNPKLIEVAKRNVTTELVDQLVYKVDQKNKRALLSYLIGFNNWPQVLVFTRMKHNANKLCEQLIEDGLTAAALHGNKSQGARTRALEDFKTGKIRVLVATDIAARGIDIEDLPHVVNYELPNVAEDYVHRIGRTGRAGKSGTAISLVCGSETQLLSDIEKLTKKTIARTTMPGFEPDPSISTMPDNSLRNNSTRSRSSRSRSAHVNGNSRSNSRTTTGNNWRSESKPAGRTTEGNKRGSWRSDSKPAGRTTEGNKRGNWRSDSKPAGRSTEGNQRGNWRSDSKPAGRTSDGNQRGNWRSDSKPAGRFTEGNQRGNWRSDSKPAGRSSEGNQRGNWRSDSKPAGRFTEGNKRGNWRSDSKPAGRTSEGSQRGNWRSDSKPAGRTSEGSQRGNWRSDSKPAGRSNAGNQRGNWRAESKPTQRRTRSSRFEVNA